MRKKIMDMLILNSPLLFALSLVSFIIAHFLIIPKINDENFRLKHSREEMCIMVSEQVVYSPDNLKHYDKRFKISSYIFGDIRLKDNYMILIERKAELKYTCNHGDMPEDVKNFLERANDYNHKVLEAEKINNMMEEKDKIKNELMEDGRRE